MELLYSAATNGFYRRSLHAGNVPLDAVSITEARYQTLMEGQRTGRRIASDSEGYPVLHDPVPTLEELSDGALSRINAGYTKAIGVILAKYPNAETLSFDKQEKQAEAWDTWQQAGAAPDDEPATPYLDAMLLERPIGKAELVARILTKAEQFTMAHGQATGRRQRLEDEINTAQLASDRAVLEIITW